MDALRSIARFFLGYGLLCALTLSIPIALVMRQDWDDIARAYPSPEYHWGVRKIPRQLWIVPHVFDAGDFDGDGTPDELTTERYRMKPIFGPSTSKLARVTSGRTGKVLLIEALGAFEGLSWAGDFDGNGTDDLAFHSWKRDRAYSLGRR